MFVRVLIACQLVFALSLAAQAAKYTEKTIYNFGVTAGDASYPRGIPVVDSSGNFYGVSEQGGTYGDGAVYKVEADGSETVLHSFDNTDGNDPQATLTLDSAGNLYGTTISGGITSSLVPQGMGVVFELTASGDFSLLYEFGSTANDAYAPFGQLALDSAGNLYGTASMGGGSCKPYGNVGCGTVFKLSSAGAETILYRFTGEADGYQPFSNIVRDSSGNLYGTAGWGGVHGEGTLFELSTKNKLTVIHAFCSQTDCGDGANPRNIIRTSDGTVYGATPGGGPYGKGIAFKIDSKGAETILHTFCPGGSNSKNCSDGQIPAIGLLSGSTLYGTTIYGGGSQNSGTAFTLTTSGAFAVIYDFNIGDFPNGLTMNSTGNLFGVTQDAGSVTAATGSLYELSKP